MLRVVYAARSFLDYRVPVFEALDELLGGGLHVIYSAEVTPARVRQKITAALGERGVGLTGERRLGPRVVANFANSSVRIVHQPGLLREIADARPDVIVGDGFFQWTSAGLLLRILRGTPLVLCYERTFHTERRAQRFRTLYRKTVLRWVDAMACNGRLSREYAEWLGMPAQRITLGHMVADTRGLGDEVVSVPEDDRRSLRRRWNDPELVFLLVAQLVPRKGLRELLGAWELAGETVIERIALVVVGDGPERGRLEEQAQEAGLKSVFFEGSVDYSRIAGYYAAADAFVIPTLEDNWSLVVPEAMACGLPVLCSKYNGCWPELVRPQNGWVFDPLDRADTVRALKACSSGRADLPEMGRASRALVAEHTPEKAAQSLLAACRIALSHRGRSSPEARASEGRP